MKCKQHKPCAGGGGFSERYGGVACKQHERGHGADDYGICENLEDTVQALLYGVGGVGTCVSHGRRADTCFIGIDAPCNTRAECLHDTEADKTAGG